MDYQEIKSFEDACALRKYDAQVLPDVSQLPEHLREYITAHYKLAVIAEAINPEGYAPDWSNYSERKYYPWPDIETNPGDEVNTAGVGFSVGDCFYVTSDASVGSRLCFPDRERCVYAFETFKDLYKAILLRS